MAYQNTKTPRIYLNIPEYLASTGVVEINPILRTLPTTRLNEIEVDNSTSIEIPRLYSESETDSITNNYYVAVINHNIDQPAEMIINEALNNYGTEIVNRLDSMQTKGFSITELSDEVGSVTFYDKEDGTTMFNVGSIMAGFYYDFPHSPDLNLTLTYSYDGISEITTRGGSTLTNSFYTKPPYSFELGDVERRLAKSGRRIWDLNFSYLSDDNVFPDNVGLSNENPDSINLTLLQDNTLQRAIHLTNGGQLPFLFQSDSSITENFQNNLAICKFDMNSFSFEQVATNIYNIKLKIKEVW